VIEVQPPSQPVLLNNVFEGAQPPAGLLQGNFVIPKPRRESAMNAAASLPVASRNMTSFANSAAA